MIRYVVAAGLSAAIALASPAPVDQAQPAAAQSAYRPDPGPYTVEDVGPIRLTDPVRKVEILTRIRLPKADGPFPVIVFSHGFGADLDAFAETSRFWASHGYVVIHPTHADSARYGEPSRDPAKLTIMRRFSAASQTGAPDAKAQAAFLAMLDDPAHIEGRAADVDLMVRALEAPGLLDEAVRRRADVSHLGLAGHSYGAYTTLVLAGAKLKRGGRMVSYARPRFTAFMPVSGQGPGRMSLTETSFASIAAPMMVVTGTRDYGAAAETPDWRLSGYRLSAPGEKLGVVIDGVAHREFDTALGAPGRGRGRGDDLKVIGLAFWDAHLKGSADAKAYLASVQGGPSGGARVDRR